MIRLCLSALLLTTALPAHADVAEAVKKHALPGYARFAEKTAALAALDTCETEPLQAAWNEAFDAWLGVAHLRLGPVEEDGRVLAIAFWPDPKGLGQKQQRALLEAADTAALTPDRMAEQSVAARGFFALERLLWPTEPPQGDYACALTHATAKDLARMAAEIDGEWKKGFAETLINPRPDGRYLNRSETRQALFTALVTGIEFNADSRVGRPLGTLDRPRPERAEARLSGRSLRDITLSLEALRGLAHQLHDPLPQTDAAFDRALKQAEKVDLARLDDSGMWLKAQILQQNIKAIAETAVIELAPALGSSVGFNSADGD
ncbi:MULTISPECIES: imelysin family protein [Gemmobacter]|uniref:Imelysin-like domain-containing protein n=1 Tax=Gemmobacter caeni TaxID=589035 RepID=A0A2T6ARW3_9RHOB|nr:MULTISPECIES: imelysin family protein [Gemmobacter]PTX46563.1 hypothetical protein C8N34_11640 [Gemmobacter caeni]TWI95412.1 hypothetical protein IQ03_03675 [Gemmobacter caeni]